MDRKHFTYSHPQGNRSLVGIAVVALYLGIWITSLLSPLLLALAIYKSCYLSASVIITLTAIAYLPEGYVPALEIVRSVLLQGICKYWTSCSMQWAAGAAPAGTRGSRGPTLLCVHPHGIMCSS